MEVWTYITKRTIYVFFVFTHNITDIKYSTSISFLPKNRRFITLNHRLSLNIFGSILTLSYILNSFQQFKIPISIFNFWNLLPTCIYLWHATTYLTFGLLLLHIKLVINLLVSVVFSFVKGNTVA